jgi:hypothetical protein
VNVTALIATGRRIAGDALLDVGSIADATQVSDGRGGWTTAYIPRPDTIRCRVVGVKDQLAADISDVLQGPNTAIILCEFGTEMDDGTHVTINSTTYQIGARISADSVTTVLERYIGREVS